MKKFHLLLPVEQIIQTVSEKLEDGEGLSTVPANQSLAFHVSRFPRGSETTEQQTCVARNIHGG